MGFIDGGVFHYNGMSAGGLGDLTITRETLKKSVFWKVTRPEGRVFPVLTLLRKGFFRPSLGTTRCRVLT